jgi:hypothetical protein
MFMTLLPGDCNQPVLALALGLNVQIQRSIAVADQRIAIADGRWRSELYD